MRVQSTRNGMALVVFTLGLVVLVTLALASTTWAAPNAQGTVPTPPQPTRQATPGGGGGNGGGQNNGGDSGGQSGGIVQNTAQPTATLPPNSAAACGIGEAGAQCTAAELVIVVGAGAVPAGSALMIEGPFLQPPCPDSPGGNNFLNRCYRFGWSDANAQPLGVVSGPVQYCISFGAEQVAITNNKPESMVIGFAGSDGAWTLVTPTLDTNASRVCATTNQPVVWGALFAPKTPAALLPTVGGTSSALWMIPLALLGVVMMLAAVRLARGGSR